MGSLGSALPTHPQEGCAPQPSPPHSQVSVSEFSKVNSVHPRHPSPPASQAFPLMHVSPRIRGKKRPRSPHWLQFSWDGEKGQEMGKVTYVPLPRLPHPRPTPHSSFPRQSPGILGVALTKCTVEDSKNAFDSQPSHHPCAQRRQNNQCKASQQPGLCL